jgi:hypothetical protein
MDRREIADKYIHGWMLIDLLSLVPFDLLVMLGLLSGLDEIKARPSPQSSTLHFVAQATRSHSACIDGFAFWLSMRAGRTAARLAGTLWAGRSLKGRTAPLAQLLTGQ